MKRSASPAAEQAGKRGRFDLQENILELAADVLKSGKVIGFTEARRLLDVADDDDDDDDTGVTDNTLKTLEHLLRTHNDDDFTDKAKRYMRALINKEATGKGVCTIIDSITFDRSCLELASVLSQASSSGALDEAAAHALWADLEEGAGVTEVERRTIKHIMDSHTLSAGARSFLASSFRASLCGLALKKGESVFDFKAAHASSERAWRQGMHQALCEFIRVPNLSPVYDDEALTNGLQEAASAVLMKWAQKQDVEGLQLQLLEEEGRTPLIMMEMAGSDPEAETVVLYGHMDKQPHLLPWEHGLGPCEPVLREGKLYGRGGANNGYALFAAVNALRILANQGSKHPRCVVLIEAGQESGSPDLPFYIEKLEKNIGSPCLLVCLDHTQVIATIKATANKAPWLQDALLYAAEKTIKTIGKPALLLEQGEALLGRGMLIKGFPHAQVVVAGVMGNAHGANEFLEINRLHAVTVSTAFLLHTIVGHRL